MRDRDSTPVCGAAHSLKQSSFVGASFEPTPAFVVLRFPLAKSTSEMYYLTWAELRTPALADDVGVRVGPVWGWHDGW